MTANKFYSLLFESEDGFHYIEITEEKLHEVRDAMKKTKAHEIIYVFDNQGKSLLLVDDYPEEINVAIELLNIA